jgi:hypothetical protein
MAGPVPAILRQATKARKTRFLVGFPAIIGICGNAQNYQNVKILAPTPGRA